MKCVACKNETSRPEETTVVFKKVPAGVCSNCGESYVDKAITEELLRTFEEAVKAHVQFDVRKFDPAELAY